MPRGKSDSQLAQRLDGLLVLRLWSVLDGFEARLEAELAQLGMSVAAFRLVGEVMRAPDGLRQNDIARRLRVRPPTVSAAVTRLEQSGVVERVADPDDPRAWRVRLARRASLGPGLAVLERLESDLVGSLESRERKELAAVLERLSSRLRSGEAP